MELSVIVALLSVVLALAAYAAIRICEINDQIDRDIEALVMSKQMTDDLNAAATDLGWHR
jgi:hypothetical protein